MKQNIKHKILGLFKSRKLNVFLLFFVLSFSILILTKLSKSYTATIPFEINPINVDDTFVVLNKDQLKLNITMETYGFNWLRYAINTPKLDVDFKTDVVKIDSSLIWSVSRGFSNINNQFNKQKKVISINPDTLLFKYDINNIKYVPVQLNTTVNFAEGYNTLETFTTLPDSVKLIGPKTILDKVKVINTESLELNDIKTDVNIALQLNLDSLGNQVKTNVKEVNFELGVSKFSEGIVQLPIEILNSPKGKRINYFPKQISISYATSLENFNNITATDFKIICDYKEAIDDAFLTPIIVKQPEGVKNVRLLQQKIEFIIKQ